MYKEIDSASGQPLLEQRAVTVSHIYKLTPQQLQKLFLENPTKKLVSPEFGNTTGVLRKLASDANSGIVGDEKDLRRRKEFFGKNTKPLPEKPRLLDSIKQQLIGEKIWWVVAGSAILSGVVSGFVVGLGGLVEGISIVISALVLIALASLADWFKDCRFVNLQSLIKDENITVIRGKFGASQSVSVWDLVVGDVILLSAGANIPFDCLVLSSYDLVVKETSRGPDGELTDKEVAKQPLDPSTEDGDPFLKANSNIVQGQTKALVCAVGKFSSGPQNEEKLNTDEDTKLQKKLKNLETQFTLYGIYGAGAIFLVMIVRLIIELLAIDPNDDSKNGVMAVLLTKLTGHINLIVVLIVVSIPEGLPLTIGVSLAFTVMRMYSERILVRSLDAPEKMGAVEEICVSKTGNLTKNDMKVNQFHCESKFIIVNRKDTLLNCELSEEAITRIKECILYNCEARVEMDTTTYVPVGNGTEVGLLKFLQDADFPVHLLIQRKLDMIKFISPFNPDRGMSCVALQVPDRPDKVCVYVKGAPEVVLEKCNSMLNQRIADIDGQERNSILQKIDQIAQNPLRVIGFAFYEMDLNDWEHQFGQRAQDRLHDFIQNQGQLTWIGAFGLKDNLRPNVKACVRYARDQGNLSIRLISGDHVQTAKAVAIKSGILRPEEAARSNSVMTGREFREKVGKITQHKSDETSEVEHSIENQSEFLVIADRLKVLARATPEDRHLLVTAFKSIGRTVAVTGAGTSDVDALQVADVGLAMGNGCAAAKEASDIVLTDSDFEATLRTVMWGRNIYHNVSRFLQFQVCVNISALATVFIGSLIFSESPLSAVQLLWINLIMDTFAAIALSTEPPLASVLQGVPFKSNAAILSGTVWRQILGISLWNVIVMVFLMLFGSLIGGLDYEFSEPTEGSSKAAEDKRRHFTYIFNTFFFLQLFNEINCRKVGRQDFNVFEKFLHNGWFLAVVIGTCAVQVLMCSKFNGLTGTEPMNKSEWGVCIAIGSTNLLISALLKLTPESWVQKINTQNMVDEDRDDAKNNKVLKMWNQKEATPDDKSEGAAIINDLSDPGADDNDFAKV